jgi:hypothetical protein
MYGVMHGAMTCVANGDGRHGCGALGKHDGGHPQRSVRQCRRGGDRERDRERDRDRQRECRLDRTSYNGCCCCCIAFERMVELS